MRGFIEKGAYEGNCAFMNELREELSRFIQNGSVSADLPTTSADSDPSGPPLDESRVRSGIDLKYFLNFTVSIYKKITRKVFFE